MDGLSALVIGHLGDRTGVDQADVGMLALVCRRYAHVFEHLAKRRGLRKIQLATKRVICCFFALKGT
jgi:hypothetical protein